MLLAWVLATFDWYSLRLEQWQQSRYSYFHVVLLGLVSPLSLYFFACLRSFTDWHSAQTAVPRAKKNNVSMSFHLATIASALDWTGEAPTLAAQQLDKCHAHYKTAELHRTYQRMTFAALELRCGLAQSCHCMHTPGSSLPRFDFSQLAQLPFEWPAARLDEH